MAAPSQTQRLQQQQQQFAAANQQVQQVQRAQDDQLAELQARMQKRVAERQKKSRRWVGGSATRMQQQQQQQQPQPQQQQDAGAAPDLSALARGGLQHKVARFASTVNFLQRSQQVRGAELSWGRVEEAFGGEGAAESARLGGAQGLEGGDWEQQLGVTRVRRQRGGMAGMDSLEATLEVKEDQSARRLQQFDGWSSYGQAGVTAVAAMEEQLDCTRRLCGPGQDAEGGGRASEEERALAGRLCNSMQQQQPPQQPQQQPQDAGAGLDLSVLARGGLQQKVARFAFTVNFLQRSQQVRGAELSWGRVEEAFGGKGAAESARPAGTQGLEGGDWEQQLGVTRVRRQRGGTAGMDSLEAALEVKKDQSARRQQQVFDGWRSYGQAGTQAQTRLSLACSLAVNTHQPRMRSARLQAYALLLLALALCASAHGGYYYGGESHRRLQAKSGFGRELLTNSYYGYGSRRLLSYGGYHGHRRLQSGAPMFVRPLFGGAFMPTTPLAEASDVPVPHFLGRQLQSTGTYYYGSHRRLQSSGSYYYGSHRRLSSYGYYGGSH
ncbi:hypothetical protein ACK3TF_003077 [Chlorella vulgaris]